jgi:hypothetical protein
LLLAQLRAQAYPVDLAGNSPPFQPVPRPPVTELFSQRLGQLRAAGAHTRARLDLRTHVGDRPIGPVGDRPSSDGVITRSAVSLFTGGGPGATLAFNASVPPRRKPLCHSCIVSSRTLNTSAMRGLVQPESFSRG